MKLRYIAMIALAALIGFSFVSCGDGDPAAGSVKYTSVKGDNTYELTITSNTSKAYTPVKDDSYVLIIKITATGVQIGESTGTVSLVEGSSLTLSTGGAAFTVTVSAGEMTAITVIGGGNIPGTNVPAPGTGMTDNSGGNQDSGSGGGSDANPLAGTSWEYIYTRAQMAQDWEESEQTLISWGIPANMPHTLNLNADMKFTFSGYEFEGGGEDTNGTVTAPKAIPVTYYGTYTVNGNRVTLKFTSGNMAGEQATGTFNATTLSIGDWDATLTKK